MVRAFKGDRCMSFRNFALKAVLAAAALSVALPSYAADPVKIGVGIAKTGPFAPAAIPTLNAYQMWADDLNAKGGMDVAGTKRPIQLVVYDDQSDFTKEAAIYEKLITDDKVDLLLSPYATPFHFAIVGVLERYKFPMVGSTAASVQLRTIKPGNIWFPTSAIPDKMGPELVSLMKKQGVKSVSISTLQSPFAQEMEKYVKAALTDSGIKLLSSQQYAMDVKDMTSIVSAIKKEQPDAVLSLSFPADSILFMKAAREQGLTAPFQFVLVGPTADFFGKIFGKNLDGVMTMGHWSPYQTKWPKGMPFFEAYSKKFNQAPDYLDVALAYMSCEITEAAVAKVGLDKEKLRKEISSTTFRYDRRSCEVHRGGKFTTPTMFLQIQDGKPQIVWPPKEETAPFQKKGPWVN
ncbi:MAG: amino acid ABC transporter substrate-binding protein [Bradyrhizobium sp.]